MKGVRVAIIGAGGCGLPAIKSCLDEGLEPVCFERKDYIGGLWHFTDGVEEDQACVMKSTVINTSKEMMCYSDFPIPREYAPYMHNRYVEKYFHLYADKFDLKKYIRFKTEVISVSRANDFKTTGRWDISYRAPGSADAKHETFDAVLVCTGHHASKKMATWPGLDKFKGKVVHSHDYKDFHGYEGKRAVVVGIGNSGCDVTIELSRVCEQVYLSTRRGAWIQSKVGDDGKPGDMTIVTRFTEACVNLFPGIMMKAAQKKVLDKFDHAKYGLMPKHNIFAQHPAACDDLPYQIMTGAVKVRGDVREVYETGVIFEDGTKADVDVIVTATGYIFGFPFLEKGVVDVKENKADLFKYMFPPDLDKHTLALIGFFQPLGAIFPVGESQCRLATRVFKDDVRVLVLGVPQRLQGDPKSEVRSLHGGLLPKYHSTMIKNAVKEKRKKRKGDVRLPSREEMWVDIREKRDALSQRYVKSTRHTMQVDYVPFMDELAELNGHKPNLIKLFFMDPKLWWECFFGPATPYQYRLHGPGAWKGAREMIMTQWDRTFHPLKGRKCDVMMSKDWSFRMIYVVVMAILAVIVYVIFR